eukprot:scaffold23020_cov79-Phaeocystis_antarctica.AAC.1
MQSPRPRALLVQVSGPQLSAARLSATQPTRSRQAKRRATWVGTTVGVRLRRRAVVAAEPV